MTKTVFRFFSSVIATIAIFFPKFLRIPLSVAFFPLDILILGAVMAHKVFDTPPPPQRDQ